MKMRISLLLGACSLTIGTAADAQTAPAVPSSDAASAVPPSDAAPAATAAQADTDLGDIVVTAQKRLQGYVPRDFRRYVGIRSSVRF